MSEQLVIRLGTDADQPIQWLVWSSEQQEVIASGELPGAEQLDSLHQRAGGRAPLVLVPATAVSLFEVHLPNRAAVKALPFMLEEQLAEEIDQLHFALGNRHGNEQQVMVVKHALMATWLDWLDSADLHPRRMLPDALALPLKEEQWSALEIGGQWLVRQGEFQGFSCDQDLLEIYMDAAIAEQAAQNQETQASVQLCCWQPFDYQHQQLELVAAPEELPMQLLAEQPASSFNLLQGRYAPRSQLAKYLLPWRYAAVAAGLLFVISLVDMGLEIRQLSQQQAALKSQVVNVYRSVFPNERRVVNPRAQMKQHLAAMSGGATGGGFFELLGKTLHANAKVKDLKPLSLKYDRDRSELRIQAESGSFQDFERFKTLVEEMKLSIEIGSLSNQKGRVSGSMVIGGTR